MTREERENWLLVAMGEVSKVPSAYFQQACEYARQVADHPAKIIPAIRKYDPGEWRNANHLTRELRDAEARLANFDAPRIAPYEPSEKEKQEIGAKFARLMEELGERTGYDA